MGALVSMLFWHVAAAISSASATNDLSIIGDPCTKLILIDFRLRLSCISFLELDSSCSKVAVVLL